nr:hypothetical protein GCM10025699_56160 [Microbacterium flavescens]
MRRRGPWLGQLAGSCPGRVVPGSSGALVGLVRGGERGSSAGRAAASWCAVPVRRGTSVACAASVAGAVPFVGDCSSRRRLRIIRPKYVRHPAPEISISQPMGCPRAIRTIAKTAVTLRITMSCFSAFVMCTD